MDRVRATLSTPHSLQVTGYVEPYPSGSKATTTVWARSGQVEHAGQSVGTRSSLTLVRLLPVLLVDFALPEDFQSMC